MAFLKKLNSIIYRIFFLDFQRHLALSLHFEHCKQNDVWPEKLIEELSQLPEILKEKKIENLESIEIDYVRAHHMFFELCDYE